MVEFVLHPNVFSTGKINGLRSLLEEMWVRQLELGEGTIFIISGFSNFNGGARFYKTFQEHTELGGKIVAILGGSASQRLSSRQVVGALLECGAKVYLVNRKRLLHAKCYGVQGEAQKLGVVSSGNFTGPGLSQNVEASVFLNQVELDDAGFDWEQVVQSIHDQNWQIHECSLHDPKAPFWDLLYDETAKGLQFDDSERETLILTLQPTDTNRILANRGETAGKGSQYFWLSKDCFDFFPALTIRNEKGWKGTFSAMIKLNYVDLGIQREERITFEAENNLDFRLGTGALRYTKMVGPDDLACLTRISDDEYELRLFQQGTTNYELLEKYAINFVGHKGKRYGYVENSKFYSHL